MNKKTIYLVAPSFGCSDAYYKTRLKEAIKNFKKLNHKIIEGKNIYLNKGVVASNSAILRANEINDAYKSNADIILSVAGGEMLIECLEYIDFELIKNNPNKIFVGFSDNTFLTYIITTKYDIPSINGRNATAYTILPFEYDIKDSYDLMNDNAKIIYGYEKYQLIDDDINPIHKYKFDNKTDIKVYNYKSKVCGRFIGGTVDCLSLICGTKYDNTLNYIKKYKEDGIIFFMESCDLNSVSLRRIILQLKYANWFNDISLFLIGRSYKYDDKSCDLPIINSYLDILLPFNKPIILDAPLGHISPTIPIKLGVKASIEIENNNIKIEYLE